MRGLSPVVVSGSYSLFAVFGLLTALASLVVEHGLWDVQALVVAACRLTCPTACGILPDQGLNLCPLHWQVNSQSLNHQGSPVERFLNHKCTSPQKLYILHNIQVFSRK